MAEGYGRLLPQPEFTVRHESFGHRAAAQLIAALDLTFEQADGVRVMTPHDLLALTAPLRGPRP